MLRVHIKSMFTNINIHNHTCAVLIMLAKLVRPCKAGLHVSSYTNLYATQHERRWRVTLAKPAPSASLAHKAPKRVERFKYWGHASEYCRKPHS